MSDSSQTSKSGNLTVTAENIFPIIKKWLYTEKEIFVRELISNATDAITKLQKLISMGEAEGTGEDYKIDVRIDAVAKKIIVEDNGVGMTAEDVQKYINEMAFSGATDFIHKFKDKVDKDALIGHFGLGFYSTFMAGDRVEIHSLSHKPNSTPVQWSCDGSTQFTMDHGTRAKRGTEIHVTVSEESADLLEQHALKELLLKYCTFMPFPISLNGAEIGTKKPLWKDNPSKLSEKDYLDFFHLLHPFEEDPLFWIHLNVDFPFHLNGILYFPKVKHELDTSRGQIKLYCNQVFVSDNCKDIIPEFLTVLKGVLDSPDIPLNVSRSQLQADPQVRKITTHIIKKISDRLNFLFEKERANYQKYWEDIHPFVKFGVLTNEKFYEQVQDALLFKSTREEGSYTNLKEYLERAEAKHPKHVYYVADPETQKSYLDLFKSQGFEVLHLNSMIDTHFVQFLEGKMDKVQFSRIDSEVGKDLIEEKQELVDSETNQTPSQHLESLFKKELGRDKIKIKAQNLKSDGISGLILFPEFQRRMKEMHAAMTRTPVDMMEEHTLILNANNNLIKKIRQLHNRAQTEGDTKKQEEVKILCEQVYDMALLGQKKLSPSEMERFLQRTQTIMDKFAEKV